MVRYQRRKWSPIWPYCMRLPPCPVPSNEGGVTCVDRWLGVWKRETASVVSHMCIPGFVNLAFWGGGSKKTYSATRLQEMQQFPQGSGSKRK